MVMSINPQRLLTKTLCLKARVNNNNTPQPFWLKTRSHSLLLQEFGRAWAVSGVLVFGTRLCKLAFCPQSGVCSKLIRDADREGTRVEIR